MNAPRQNVELNMKTAALNEDCDAIQLESTALSALILL